MNIFVLLIIAMAIIVVLLRKHIAVGPAMVAGGLFLWAVRSLDPVLLGQAALETLQKGRTYDLVAALALVMCLEIELRTSGTLSGMVQALQRLFSSAKVILAIMPAFLGLLPSLGGARFSAPIVEEASKGLGLNEDDKAAINFWFRHPFEFSNPIIAGMIMACSIAGVSYGDFVVHTFWMSGVCLIVGWMVLIHPIKASTSVEVASENQDLHKNILDIALSLSPVIGTFLLVTMLKLNASIAMGIMTALLFVVLKLLGRELSLKEVVLGAFDKKMFLNVFSILYFIQLLTDTNVLQETVEAFRAAPLPIPVIVAAVSLVIGVLTGMSQAHVSIIMPIVAAIDPGNLNLAAVAMIFGVAGQMLTPTHMCLIVTLDFFEANIFKTLKPILLIECIVLTIFSGVMYSIW